MVSRALSVLLSVLLAVALCSSLPAQYGAPGGLGSTEHSLESIANSLRSFDSARIHQEHLGRAYSDRADAANFGMQGALQMNALQQQALQQQAVQLQQSFIQQNSLRLEVTRLKDQVKKLEKDLKRLNGDQDSLLKLVQAEDTKILSAWLTVLFDFQRNPQAPKKKVVVTFEPL